MAPLSRPVLVYDGDCGFCTSSARAARRLGCAVETVPWQRWPDLATYGITPEQAAAKVQLVDGAGVWSGHLAAARALATSDHVVVRWSGRLVGAPALAPLARTAYAAVSRYRAHLPGGTPACAATPDSTQPPEGE